MKTFEYKLEFTNKTYLKAKSTIYAWLDHILLKHVIRYFIVWIFLNKKNGKSMKSLIFYNKL